MEIVTFEVPGNPVPQSRPRFTKNGHAYEDKKVKTYKECVRTVAASKMRGRPPMEGAVIASLKFLLPVPKSWSRKKRTGALAGEILPTSRPDTDNLTKTVLDACNGIIYADDSQIIHMTAQKWYGEEPGVVVEFRG